MLKFMTMHADVTVALSRMLGVRFMPDSRHQDGAIGRALKNALQDYFQGRQREAEAEIARLALLAKQLQLIGQKRPDVFKPLRRRFLTGRLDDYHGARQETTVAAALIRAALGFHHEPPDGPDFVAYGPAGEAGIECTSVHLQQTKDRDLFYKVESALRKKADKNYGNRSVALTISTTSIEADEEIDRQRLAESLRKTPFGAGLKFTSMMNRDHDPPSFQSNYMRVDAGECAPELLGVLDLVWPRGKLEVEEYIIPGAP